MRNPEAILNHMSDLLAERDALRAQAQQMVPVVQQIIALVRDEPEAKADPGASVGDVVKRVLERLARERDEALAKPRQVAEPTA